MLRVLSPSLFGPCAWRQLGVILGAARAWERLKLDVFFQAHPDVLLLTLGRRHDLLIDAIGDTVLRVEPQRLGDFLLRRSCWHIDDLFVYLRGDVLLDARDGNVSEWLNDNHFGDFFHNQRKGNIGKLSYCLLLRTSLWCGLHNLNVSFLGLRNKKISDALQRTEVSNSCSTFSLLQTPMQVGHENIHRFTLELWRRKNRNIDFQKERHWRNRRQRKNQFEEREY